MVKSPIFIFLPSGNSKSLNLEGFFKYSYFSYSKLIDTKQHFSLISLAISFSLEDSNDIPSSLMYFYKYSVKSQPARFIQETAYSIEYPSKTTTMWLTPSPESQTTPVVLPVEYNAKTA